MHVDVSELRDFYTTPLGQVVRRLLSARIRARWPSVRSQTVVGLGFATPYLGAYRSECSHLAALMPADQGALVWPREGGVLSALTDEDQLPLGDASVDKLLAVHCIEGAERVRPLLREIWRVLAPEGSVILVVPNRRGVWARIDSTPFGYGRPYSRRQLMQLLEESMFHPVDWSPALFLPPLDKPVVVKSAVAFERIGARITPGFAGVTVVEAKKELVAAIGKVARVRGVRDLAVSIRR
ncbi:MAG: methyltransferase domain-containing protein [Hyphomicrobiaceae bacterium]|nr:methyltransferase domain-containing protein [Hyphomicrobiaceae bacterium]